MRTIVNETEAEKWLLEKGLNVQEMRKDYFLRSLRGFLECKTMEGVNRTIYESRVRDEFISEFGFAILGADAVHQIRKYGPLIEIGSGTGHWAYELAKAGIDIVATDKFPPAMTKNQWFSKQWCEIKHMNGAAAVREHSGRNLLTVWPSYSERWAYTALKVFDGEYVLYEGEYDGGCTADDAFHNLLERKFEQVESLTLPHFQFVKDYLGIWKRK